MSLRAKIVRNVGIVTLAEVISNLFSYFLIILIARELGAAGLGLYSFAFAFAGIFSFAYDFGISTHFIRESAKSKEHAMRHFGHYAFLKLLFCAIAFLLPLISILILKKYLASIIAVCLASASLLFQN